MEALGRAKIKMSGRTENQHEEKGGQLMKVKVCVLSKATGGQGTAINTQ